MDWGLHFFCVNISFVEFLNHRIGTRICFTIQRIVKLFSTAAFVLYHLLNFSCYVIYHLNEFWKTARFLNWTSCHTLIETLPSGRLGKSVTLKKFSWDDSFIYKLNPFPPTLTLCPLHKPSHIPPVIPPRRTQLNPLDVPPEPLFTLFICDVFMVMSLKLGGIPPTEATMERWFYSLVLMQILFLPDWTPVMVLVYLVCDQWNANILQAPTDYLVPISYRNLATHLLDWHQHLLQSTTDLCRQVSYQDEWYTCWTLWTSPANLVFLTISLCGSLVSFP